MTTKKISTYIKENFDTRCEVMVASYILSKGTEYLRNVTDEEISLVEGNGLMTQDFVQALIRTAKHICVNATEMDIMSWIRKECWFAPFPKMVVIHKDDVSEDFYYDLCNELSLDDEEDSVTVYVFKGEENG